MTLGERIKACRQSAKLSQEQVAELLGVSRQAVTKWENDRSAPSTENLVRLAEIFGTTVDRMLGFERTEVQPAEPDAEPLDEQEIIRRYIEKRENEKAARREKRKRKFIKALPKLIAAFVLLIVLGILSFRIERWYAMQNDDLLIYATLMIDDGHIEPDIYISEHSGIEYHTYNFDFPSKGIRHSVGISFYEDETSVIVVDRSRHTMKEYRNGVLFSTTDTIFFDWFNVPFEMKSVRTVEECEQIEALIAAGDYETIETEYDGEVIHTAQGVFVN